MLTMCRRGVFHCDCRNSVPRIERRVDTRKSALKTRRVRLTALLRNSLAAVIERRHCANRGRYRAPQIGQIIDLGLELGD